jgi:hypothetical protein
MSPKHCNFMGKVCAENSSLKLFIPKECSNYIGIMAGDHVEVKIVRVKSTMK